jgi:glutathione S-transferase
MSAPVLVIGNRNYSSWSLRAWLALRHCDYAFDTHRIPMDTPSFASEIAVYTRAGRVPVLIDGGESIWDSLAIAEYVAERTGKGWPADPRARAVARSVTCEMHSGFASLRNAWPMDIRARHPSRHADAAVTRDLARIDELWTDCRARFGAGGPWLFGDYTIADAYYAPIVCRLQTYGSPGFGSVSAAYCATMLADPHLAQWSAAAALEQETLL